MNFLNCLINNLCSKTKWYNKNVTRISTTFQFYGLEIDFQPKIYITSHKLVKYNTISHSINNYNTI